MAATPTDKIGGYGLGGFYLGGPRTTGTRARPVLEIQGSNLGFDSRSFSAQYKEQGSWSAKLYYGRHPYVQSDTFHSVFNLDGAWPAD